MTTTKTPKVGEVWLCGKDGGWWWEIRMVLKVVREDRLEYLVVRSSHTWRTPGEVGVVAWSNQIWRERVA